MTLHATVCTATGDPVMVAKIDSYAHLVRKTSEALWEQSGEIVPPQIVGFLYDKKELTPFSFAVVHGDAATFVVVLRDARLKRKFKSSEAVYCCNCLHKDGFDIKNLLTGQLKYILILRARMFKKANFFNFWQLKDTKIFKNCINS